MILFTNDYNRGAHPAVLRALTESNGSSFPGYGTDEACQRAAALIRAEIADDEAEVHFLVGGTQVNSTVIAAGLRPWQSVLSVGSGHIAQHETGAVERSGHKVEILPGPGDKVDPDRLERAVTDAERSTVPEHITEPAMVYLSQPTELGSLYTRDELTAVSRVAHAHGLLLVIDGARMAYALGSPANELSLAETAARSDALTIGGTKCGALFGEAAVLRSPRLRTGFRSMMKQNGALLAKGWLLGLQFEALFTDGLYRRIGAEADARAQRIRRILAGAGIETLTDSPTNQQFFVVDSAQLDALASQFGFEYWQRLDEEHHCIRLCTSWSTRDEELDALARAVTQLPLRDDGAKGSTGDKP